MDIDHLTDSVARAVSGVDGLAAVALGGSRARGTHLASSDIDLALYYDPAHPLDVQALRHIAVQIDDSHRPDLLTEVGGWGPWINGGGWLHVAGQAVDLLYRDLRRVQSVVDDCLAGRVQVVYQPGHPLGFSTNIYLSEVAICRVLEDKTGRLDALKKQATPYPAALRSAIVQRFFWECDFSLQVAEKGAARRDVSYVAGCLFRCSGCLMQTLFALNGEYWLNEKGAAALAARFALCPPRLEERLGAAFASLEPGRLAAAIAILAGLVRETGALMRG